MQLSVASLFFWLWCDECDEIENNTRRRVAAGCCWRSDGGQERRKETQKEGKTKKKATSELLCLNRMFHVINQQA